MRSAAALLATLLKVSPFLSQEFSLAFLAGGGSGPKEAMAENWAPLMWAPMRDDARLSAKVARDGVNERKEPARRRAAVDVIHRGGRRARPRRS